MYEYSTVLVLALPNRSWALKVIMPIQSVRLRFGGLFYLLSLRESETVKLATKHANLLLASFECCDSLAIGCCDDAESVWG